MHRSNLTVPIATLIEDARREGVWFPHDPSGNGAVQIRLHRSASADGHRLAAVLRERRDEVNHFFKERRPAWPVTDDGLPPLPDIADVPYAIWALHLEAIIAETEMQNALEDAGRELLQIRAGFRERCADIVRNSAAGTRR